MKKTLLILSICLSGLLVKAQDTIVKTIPAALVKTLDGKNFNTRDLNNDGKPMVIDFWATWCKPCVAELNAITEEYAEWQKETGVKIVAISIDDTRNMLSVAPFVSGKGWDYEVYLDPNGDFRRAMNVNNVPHVFLFDGKGNLVLQHNSYSPGDEDKLYEEIKKLTGK
ncbi:thiol-disulfide oxidoreductase ResA [soil metagenome]